MKKNKKSSKNKNTIFIGIGIVILLVILGIIIYLEANNDDLNNSSNLSTDISNATLKNATDENTILKQIEDKELVYTAEYLPNEDNDLTYTIQDTNNEYKINDIVVPYINLNCEDAKKVNSEIKNKYDELVSKFKYERDNQKSSYDMISYKAYVNSDILSVILIEKTGCKDETINYYTYNFDINTLEQITYKDLYISVGYKDTNIDEKVKKCIASNDIFVNQSKEGKDINSYVIAASNSYQTSVIGNTIKCFLDKTGKLNVVVEIETPTDNKKTEKVIEIK